MKMTKKDLVTDGQFNSGIKYLNDSNLKEFNAKDRLSIIEFVAEVVELQKPIAEFERKTFEKYNKELDEALSVEVEFKSDVSEIVIPSKLIGTKETKTIIGLMKIFKLHK